MSLYHDCWRHILGQWKDKTQNVRLLTLGNGSRHQVRWFLGWLLGDQQVHIVQCAYFTYFVLSCIFHTLFIKLHIVYCFVCFAYKLCLCICWEHDKLRLPGEGLHVCHRWYAKGMIFCPMSMLNWKQSKTVKGNRKICFWTGSSGVDIPFS